MPSAPDAGAVCDTRLKSRATPKPESPRTTKPDAVAAVAGQAAQVNVTAMRGRKRGVVLTESVIKHPDETGHLITEAIATARSGIAKPEPAQTN